jgi:hypothetical protein
LRIALAEFDQLAARNELYQHNLHDFFVSSFDPFLRSRIPLLSLGVFGSYPAARFRLRTADLVGTREFENIFAARIGFGGDVLTSSNRLLESVDRVLEELKRLAPAR